MASPNVVAFDYAQGDEVGQRHVNAAAEDGADAVIRGKSGRAQLVPANQGMHEEVGVIAAEHKAGTDGQGLFIGTFAICGPVLAVVTFHGKKPAEIASHGCADAPGRVRKILADGSVVASERGRHSAAGMSPLIAGEDVIFRNGLILRESGKRQET